MTFDKTARDLLRQATYEDLWCLLVQDSDRPDGALGGEQRAMTRSR